MSSAVTRTGLEGVAPGRDAIVGANAGSRTDGQARRKRTGRRGEQPMVPEAEFTSYYGMPILNGPVWHRTEIAGYLYLGGLSGASSLLAAGAQRSGRPRLATRAHGVALVAIALSAAALVKDLGRPERFANMLRVLKPTSPMSVGSWLLAAYGPATGVAALTGLTGRFRRVGALASITSAAFAPAVATYTAALLADTAVPAWHDGFRELPFLFAGSSATAAGGMALVWTPAEEAAPARRFAAVGAVIELVAARRMKRRLGLVAEPYEQGTAGRAMTTGSVLTGAGLVLAVAGRRRRALQVLAGAVLTSASAITRVGIFDAGVQSAEDPRYTVEPQRARVDRRAGESPR
jgi:formate-dependent nitrite reductase membrane component NrfD